MRVPNQSVRRPTISNTLGSSDEHMRRSRTSVAINPTYFRLLVFEDQPNRDSGVVHDAEEEHIYDHIYDVPPN